MQSGLKGKDAAVNIGTWDFNPLELCHLKLCVALQLLWVSLWLTAKHASCSSRPWISLKHNNTVTSTLLSEAAPKWSNYSEGTTRPQQSRPRGWLWWCRGVRCVGAILTQNLCCLVVFQVHQRQTVYRYTFVFRCKYDYSILVLHFKWLC